ncbi:hypothetical protein [Pseudomonas chlororaphis]|uniref:hypothetical protein n=1 Tax=Pseudomonas chlororaphis TaxID=587753 RepID=UPI000F57BD64|nr:hypothetical protein [Pseudomonas chlororaphis]
MEIDDSQEKVPGSVDEKATQKALPNVTPDVAALKETTTNAIEENSTINEGATRAETTTPASSLTTSRSAVPSTLSSVGPTTASLKEKFSAQKIPLQTDFANLIDVADCERKAVGLSPAQPGGAGAGLLLDAEERLAVLPGNGISVGASVGVMVEANKGLIVGANGVAVQAGNGISVGASVGVTANAGRAIIVDSGGVGINYGSTLQVTNQQLGVSDNFLQRKTISSTIPSLVSATCFKIMSIPSGMKNAYAQVYITSSLTGQKFVFTICCDGGVSASGGTYSMSISNFYRPSAGYAVTVLYLYRESNNDMSVCIFINDASPTTVSMNYSPCDIQGFTLYPFIQVSVGGPPPETVNSINSNSNNSVQGA